MKVPIAKSTRSVMKAAAPREATLVHLESKTDFTSSDPMDFDDDEPPPLISADSDDEDEDDAMNTATTLSSDTSSAIDHYGIRDAHDEDPSDSDVVDPTANLMNIASEKAIRGYNQARSIYIQGYNLNLAQNNANLLDFNRIFETIIYPALSNELRLAIQHLRPKMDIRQALSIIKSKVVITNTILYLAKLESMLSDTRILPGDTIDMLVARIDLIFSTRSRLTRSGPATNNDFALSMIQITANSSPVFDTVNTKIQTSSDASMSRPKIIQIYTSTLQVATKPSAPPPVFYFKHSSTINTSHGRQPIGLGPQYQAPRAILPPNFGNRSSPRPSFTYPNPVPNRVSFQTPPQYVAAANVTPNTRNCVTPPARTQRHNPVTPAAPRTIRPAEYKCSEALKGCGNYHPHFTTCPTTNFIHQSIRSRPDHDTWMRNHAQNPFQKTTNVHVNGCRPN